MIVIAFALAVLLGSKSLALLSVRLGGIAAATLFCLAALFFIRQGDFVGAAIAGGLAIVVFFARPSEANYPLVIFGFACAVIAIVFMAVVIVR